MEKEEEVVLSFKHGLLRTPNQVLLNDVDFSIKKGDVVLLLGPNGCGKSSLIKCLLGFSSLKFEAQEMVFATQPVALNQLSSLSDAVGYCEQSPLEEFRSPFDELLFNGRNCVRSLCAPYIREGRYATKDEVYHVIDTLFEDFDQGQNRNLAAKSVRRMSGGEREVVGIIACLARVNSPLYILDEPLNNLDTHSMQCLLDKIEHKKPNETFLIVTHCRLFAHPNKVGEIRNQKIEDVSSSYCAYDCLSSLCKGCPPLTKKE
jgi:ABC-type cobalamin/Fe3+-siderophores transport system ATPase subunit